MGEAQDTIRPKGLFDRSTKGLSLPTAPVEVERSQIRFFASVLGASDPVHFDLAAARAAGHPDLVAPPSFFMPLEAAADTARERLGQPSLLKFIAADFRHLLHGGERYEYRGPIYAGDTLAFDVRVVDFYEKKAGLMEFVTVESIVSHADRGVLVVGSRTLLHRLG